MTTHKGQVAQSETRNQKLNKPELLAPAGSYAAFEAAVEQGADAVYVGTPGLNARALSRDFTFAEIGFMIKEAHACGVRLFVAMNSIIKEDELKGAVEALSILGGLRSDALIIQDQGLLFIARKWFPEIPLHASTLMAANNSLAVQGLTDLGFSRVVLARELTIDEIGRIHKQTGADIEVFVHGAMCFSYSGLCMFSSLHGGKSSLRGQCVQPCRRDYAVVESLKRTGKGQKPSGVDKEKRKYFFSMHDLCAVDVLPELRDAGVGCLKIEGRLKSASYVANCVSAYRMALDCMDEPLAEQERVLREAHRLLDAAMARKRSSGYMFSKNPVEAVSPEISGSSGQLLGRVEKISFAGGGGQPGLFKLFVPLVESVSVGDRVRFHDDKSGTRSACTLRFIETGGKRCKQAQAGGKVWLGMHGDLKSIRRDNFAGSLYRVDVKGRINIERKGIQRTKHLKGIRVNANGRQVNRILDELGWKATHDRQKSPPQRDRQSFGRRQDYGRKKTGAGAGAGSRSKTIPCWLGVRNIHDLKQRLPFRPARLLLPLSKDNIRGMSAHKGVVKKNQGRIIWQLPPVIEEMDLKWFRDEIRKLVTSGFQRFELGHFAQHELFSDYKGNENVNGKKEFRPRSRTRFKPKSINLELFGHYSLNVLNSAALQMVNKVGLRGVAFSLETESGNLRAAFADFAGDRQKYRGSRMLTGLFVYGRPPLFTARLDLRNYNQPRQVESPREERFTIERREGLTRVRSVLPFSLLHLQDEIVESGIDYMVFDLSGSPIKQEVAIVNSLLTNPGKRRQQVLSGNYHGVMV